MPDYNITAPDGLKYKVTAPEGASQDDIINYVKAQHPAKEAAQQTGEQPSTFGDMAKSFGRGVAKGAIGLVGLPGDMERLEGEGIKIVGRSLGLPEPPAGAGDPVLSPPSSGQIQQGVESVTGKFGDPQTTAGKYAQSVGNLCQVPS